MYFYSLMTPIQMSKKHFACGGLLGITKSVNHDVQKNQLREQRICSIQQKREISSIQLIESNYSQS